MLSVAQITPCQVLPGAPLPSDDGPRAGARPQEAQSRLPARLRGMLKGKQQDCKTQAPAGGDSVRSTEKAAPRPVRGLCPPHPLPSAALDLEGSTFTSVDQHPRSPAPSGKPSCSSSGPCALLRRGTDSSQLPTPLRECVGFWAASAPEEQGREGEEARPFVGTHAWVTSSQLGQ